ncbi:S-adenosyl-L-methionine-dependentmethyltransferases superfamily protein [Striga asiatica]|uniref:S-adenosyl-L-methionine-dependentmethyltransferases superfamily protein n=1 Tax=Striga asiatica TaxID=4170 RepID=A0A5A7R108_STRAF|nr:S-adenosyl-L-methionine-dependentmethyltransferases superfamily protein [Striga asiatica]
MTQNCSFRHHSSRPMPDHLTSRSEMQTRQRERDVEGLDDELSSEEGECREEAVDDEEDGGEGVDADVEVGDALEELESGGGEEGVVAGEEDLDGAGGPAEDLVETVGEVDGSSAAEGVAARDAVDGAPAAVVHAVARHHVLGDRAVDPPDAIAPLRVVFVPQEMTAIASAAVGASSGGRGTSSAPGGLPFLTEK